MYSLIEMTERKSAVRTSTVISIATLCILVILEKPTYTFDCYLPIHMDKCIPVTLTQTIAFFGVL